MSKPQEHNEVSQSAVRTVTEVDPMLLEEHFAQLPGDLARYNELYAQAFHRLLQAKSAVDREWARIYLETRETSEKMTEATLKAHVEVSEDYQAVRAVVIDAEIDKIRLGGILEAIRAKKDALISIGAHIRAEMGGSPAIRERHRGARDVEDSRGIDSDD